MTARELAGMTRGARHAIVFLFALSVLLAAANLLWTSHEVSKVRTSVIAQCKFDSDIGGAPIAVNPQSGKAPLLGVSIVADARQAWRGLHCPGKLPPAAPSFRRWAKLYKLPSN